LSSAGRAQLRREVDEIIDGDMRPRVRGGLVGIGCVGDVFSPGTSVCRHGSFRHRPDRLARDPIEDVQEALLRRLRTSLRGRPSMTASTRSGADESRDPRSDGATSWSAICARLFQLDRDERFSKQVVARPVPP